MFCADGLKACRGFCSPFWFWFFVLYFARWKQDCSVWKWNVRRRFWSIINRSHNSVNAVTPPKNALCFALVAKTERMVRSSARLKMEPSSIASHLNPERERESERKEWPRDGHLFSTNRPPASSCIWAASHAKRPPVPVQLPLGVWGAPLQQDMCYWLEEKEIRLQNTQTLLLFSLYRHSPLSILHSFSLPFSVFLIPARLWTSGYVSHQRDREWGVIVAPRQLGGPYSCA